MKNTIVSANWLKENLHSKDLVIIDASPEGNVSGLASEYDGVQITGARPVSLKKDLSKKDSLFPNTLPDPADLQKTARRHGINKTSVVVVYDNLGIYTAPRVWWLFITMGLTECYVLDGGLPEWVKAKGETESRKLYSGKKGNFEAIGLIDLFDFDAKNKRVGIGIIIQNEVDRNNGFGKEAFKVLNIR